MRERGRVVVVNGFFYQRIASVYVWIDRQTGMGFPLVCREEDKKAREANVFRTQGNSSMHGLVFALASVSPNNNPFLTRISSLDEFVL